jgi:hypothetical protein
MNVKASAAAGWRPEFFENWLAWLQHFEDRTRGPLAVGLIERIAHSHRCEVGRAASEFLQCSISKVDRPIKSLVFRQALPGLTFSR